MKNPHAVCYVRIQNAHRRVKKDLTRREWFDPFDLKIKEARRHFLTRIYAAPVREIVNQRVFTMTSRSESAR